MPSSRLVSVRSSPYERTKSLFKGTASTSKTPRSFIGSSASTDRSPVRDFRDQISQLHIYPKPIAVQDVTGKSYAKDCIELDFRYNGNKTPKTKNNYTNGNSAISSSSLGSQKSVYKRKNFRISPEAVEKGYWCSPSMEQLEKYAITDIASLPNFMVGRKGYGTVAFNQTVNLTGFDNLEDLLDNIVVFKHKAVSIYSDEKTKPAPGQGVNVPATVTLENISIVDPSTGLLVKDSADSMAVNFTATLRKSLVSKGGEHLMYDVERGLWTFRVPHFSIWGLDDSEEQEDEVQTPNIKTDKVLPQLHQPGPPQTFHQPVPGSWGLPDAFEANSQSEYARGSNTEITPSSNFFQPAPSSAFQQTFQAFQPVQPSFQPAPPPAFAFEPVQPDFQPSPQPVSQPTPRSEHPFSQELVIRENKQYPNPISTNWVQQLALSSSVFSPLAIKSKTLITETNKQGDDVFTAADLDDEMYGGSQSLASTWTAQYLEASDKLRLPQMGRPLPIGSFSGNGRVLLTRDPSRPSGVRIESPFKSDFDSHDLSELEVNTSLSKRGNGLPVAKSKPDLDFRFLSQKLFPTSPTRETRMWDLASLLFDDIKSLGFDTTPNPNISANDHSRIIESFRRGLLSQWLEEVTKSKVQAEIDSQQSDLSRVVTYLTGNCIVQAAVTAANSNNLHLATVISLFGSGTEFIRTSAKEQLDAWYASGAVVQIPVEIRIVYEFLAGNTTVSKEYRDGTRGQTPSVYLSRNLDWTRALGLRLWFETTDRDPISFAVAAYESAFSLASNGVQAPLRFPKRRQFDVCYELLKLYESPDGSLARVVEPLASGNSNVDYRVAWFLCNVLSSRSSSLVAIALKDRLTVDYAVQLEQMGNWIEAIFILSHLTHDSHAKKLTEEIISWHIEEVIADASLRKILTSKLLVDEGVIFQTEALWFRYQGQFWDEADSLIKANLWTEAHITIIKRVAPQSVIQQQLPRLIDLLQRFSTNMAYIEEWGSGGQVYLDYALLSTGHYSGHDSGPVFDRLIQSLGNILYTDRWDVRVSVSIISDFIGKACKEARNVNIAGILHTQIGAVEYLQQTRNLAVNYFQSKFLTSQ